jgi:hypothetical protein
LFCSIGSWICFSTPSFLPETKLNGQNLFTERFWRASHFFAACVFLINTQLQPGAKKPIETETVSTVSHHNASRPAAKPLKRLGPASFR